MATWTEFTRSAPRLAEAIRGLVHQFGPGFGYLATVRRDGGPRVHPVSPVITDEGLFCFVVDSPKRGDLDRDGRYALHSFAPEDSDDEAYLAGRAIPVTDPDRRARIAQFSRAAGSVDWHLYEFTVDSAMLCMPAADSATPRMPVPDPATASVTTADAASLPTADPAMSRRDPVRRTATGAHFLTWHDTHRTPHRKAR